MLTEYLDSGHTRQDGVSWVMQLGSAASARAELAATLRDEKAECNCSYTSYSVGTIPGAFGFREAGNGSFVGDNVLFADGPFLYLVGHGWAAGAKHPPTRAALIAAATRLFGRVHGHPAG